MHQTIDLIDLIDTRLVKVIIMTRSFYYVLFDILKFITKYYYKYYYKVF